MKALWAVAPNAEQERNQNALRRKHTDQPELPESSRWTRSAVGARLNKGLVTAGELFLILTRYRGVIECGKAGLEKGDHDAKTTTKFYG
jgi:hypothetical protein